MKTSLHLILLLCVLLSLFACGHKPYPHSLITADSLSNVNADSAIALLNSLKGEMRNTPEATQMYYRLLCIKANDKAYITHTSDSLILPVLHYYIDANNEQHLPEAYYYAGRVYRDLGDAPQALEYFEKATEALPEDGGYALKSKIYSQMGTLFDYQDLYAEALDMYKKGGQCDSIIRDSISMIYKFRDMANMNIELNRQDRALSYFKKANQLSLQLGRTDLFNMVQSQLASFYIDLQEYDSARIALQNALKNIILPDKSAIYSISARFYDATNNTDSAVWYYNELLGFGSVYAKKTAYRKLLELAIKQNDKKQASEYLYGYLLYVDSIQKLTQTETVQRMHSLYNYQLREKENLQLKAENHNNIFWLWSISGGLIMVLLSFIAYSQYSKRKNLKLKQQLEKLRIIEKENQEKILFLETHKSQKEELEKSLANINTHEDNIQERQLGQRIELLNHIMQQKTIENEQEKEAKEYLFNSDLYKQLQERINSARGEAYITSEEWVLLKELTSPAFPTFFQRLYSLHTLNENELHVCVLLKLQFRPADIARLLQLKPESISSIRKRLYRKVTGNNGNPEMWDKIIHSL